MAARIFRTALSRSCVGVLLVSPDFLASDFIYDEELPPLLEGADAGSIILVPIPISASNYKATPAGAITSLRIRQTVRSTACGGPDRNAALVRIVRENRRSGSEGSAGSSARTGITPPHADRRRSAPVAATGGPRVLARCPGRSDRIICGGRNISIG